MKAILYYKYADIAMQLLALVTPLGLAFIKQDINYFAGCYLSVICAQLVSCLWNAVFFYKILRHRHRGQYGWLVLAFLAATVVLGLVLGPLVLYFLLAAAPFLACW